LYFYKINKSSSDGNISHIKIDLKILILLNVEENPTMNTELYTSMSRPNETMNQHQHHHQIIFNKVPHAEGNEKSITFQKDSETNFVTYHELFEFLEVRTGIPKKYFIIYMGNHKVTYIDTYLAYYSSYGAKYTHYTPRKPHESLNVRLNRNINYHIYKFYENSLKSNLCDATYLELLEFSDNLYKSYYTSDNIRDLETVIQCYDTLYKYESNYKLLSPFKQFSIMTKQKSLTKRLTNLSKL